MTDSPDAIAERIYNTLQRDLGIYVAAFFDQDWTKMSDDELRMWALLWISRRSRPS